MYPVVIFGLGVVGAIIAYVVTANRHRSWEQQQQYRHQNWTPQEPPAPRQIGTCCYCEGDVTNYSGYLLPCNHCIHHTCAAVISQALQNPNYQRPDATVNSIVCRKCIEIPTNNNCLNAQRNSGLRNRVTNRPQCAECQRDIADGVASRELACERHQVHETCWDKMQESGFTTCSACFEETALQSQ